MSNVHAQGTVGANGCMMPWSVDFDDAANTVTVNTTHTRFDGSPCSDPSEASITVTLNTSVNITVDCLTGKLSSGGDFSQTSPGELLNAGPKVRTGVRLRVSPDRAAVLAFTVRYTPPLIP
jgi:phage baseplate assembly protein gpV